MKISPRYLYGILVGSQLPLWVFPWVMVVPCIVFLPLCFFIDDTPLWLVKQVNQYFLLDLSHNQSFRGGTRKPKQLWSSCEGRVTNSSQNSKSWRLCKLLPLQREVPPWCLYSHDALSFSRSPYFPFSLPCTPLLEPT